MNEKLSKADLVKKSLVRKRDAPSYEGFGKLPPQETELESVLLGAILIDSQAIEDVIQFIKDDVFYKDPHQCIWRAIRMLYEKSEPIDILTVTAQLRKNDELDRAGGAYYVTQLSNMIGSSANTEFHAKIVYEAYLKRATISISSEATTDAYDGTTDAFDVIEKAEQSLSLLSQNRFGSSSKQVSSAMYEEIHAIEKRMSMGENQLTGITSGFRELDQITGGWQNSDLIIVAGRPAMGKTAATLNFARHASIIGGRSVGVFSLEMSASQLVQRLIAGESEIANDRIRNGALNKSEWDCLTSSLDSLGNSKIIIDDTPALSVIELKSLARRMKKEQGVELIVIDYLQLMSGVGSRMEGNREQEISAISRGLKALAKELNIPIIALSQLSRAVETRGGEKKPILSDLRESGSIEQDADIVIFLYRPEYYGFDTDPDGLPNAGIGFFNIAKHRNGELKEIRVGFDGKFTKFKNLHDMGGIENHNRASEMQSGISPAMKKYVTRKSVEPQDSQTNEGIVENGTSNAEDPTDDQPF